MGDTLLIGLRFFFFLNNSVLLDFLRLRGDLFRDGDTFRYILAFLRDGDDWPQPSERHLLKRIEAEARYFGIQPLLTRLERALRPTERRDEPQAPRYFSAFVISNSTYGILFFLFLSMLFFFKSIDDEPRCGPALCVRYFVSSCSGKPPRPRLGEKHTSCSRSTHL